VYILFSVVYQARLLSLKEIDFSATMTKRTQRSQFPTFQFRCWDLCMSVLKPVAQGYLWKSRGIQSERVSQYLINHRYMSKLYLTCYEDTCQIHPLGEPSSNLSCGSKVGFQESVDILLKHTKKNPRQPSRGPASSFPHSGEKCKLGPAKNGPTNQWWCT